MVVFSRILQALGRFNFVVSAALIMYGYIFPAKIEGGTFVNSLGFLFAIFAFLFMLILISVFYFKTGTSNVENFIVFNVNNIILYVITGINLVYWLIFANHIEWENGTELTSTKLMVFVSLAWCLNLTIVIITSNYLKSIRQ